MLSYTLSVSYACMVYPRLSSLIAVANSLLAFWEQLHTCLGTRVIRSSAYHPQTDGQTERINQILEDMFRACVLAYPQKWDQCLR